MDAAEASGKPQRCSHFRVFVFRRRTAERKAYRGLSLGAGPGLRVCCEREAAPAHLPLGLGHFLPGIFWNALGLLSAFVMPTRTPPPSAPTFSRQGCCPRTLQEAPESVYSEAAGEAGGCHGVYLSPELGHSRGSANGGAGFQHRGTHLVPWVGSPLRLPHPR